MAPPTVVLIHGAWHGGWCWENVAHGLRNAGIELIVVDLPGHDQAGSSQRKWNTLKSYVDHVHQVVDGIDGEVILVGHSMGGLVTQRVLETRRVNAAVLLASIPLKGAGGVLARLTRHHPEQILPTLPSLSLWSIVANNDRVRQHFFSVDADSESVEQAGAKMQNESFPAFLSMLFRWPRPDAVLRHGTPITVIAAKHDAIFTLGEQRGLARAYNAELEIFDCAHDVMLEPVWPDLVDRIIGLSLAG